MTPKDADPLRYANRGINNMWSAIRDLINKDVQNFSEALIMVEKSEPTGNLSEADHHCMAIAIHVKKVRGLDYSFARFGVNGFDPSTTWDNYLAFLELRHHPKFAHNSYYVNNVDDNIATGGDVNGNNNNITINDNIDSDIESGVITPNNKTIQSDQSS